MARGIVTAVLALLGAFAEARAQSVGANAVVLASNHQPLGSPLIGGELAVRTRGGDSSFSIVVGGAMLRGHADRFGTPCSGLIPPTPACAAQTLRDDGRIAAGTLGAGFPIVHSHRVRLSLTADLTAAQFHVESRPQAGGGGLVGDKWMIGAYLGGEAMWYPSARLPVAVEASIALGGLRPVVNDQVVDGYEPFDGGLSARRIQTGLSWRVR